MQAFTDRALVLASTANQVKISATLHWQRRRILKKQGNRPQVISAYQSAVTDLENLHQDLVAVNPHLKFSFRYSGRLPMSVLHDGKQFYGRLATILRQNLWTSFIDI